MKQRDDFPIHELPGTAFMAFDKSTAFGAHAAEHRIKFYALIWFQEDADIHSIDFETYPISKNLIYLIGPDQVHTIPAETMPEAKVLVWSSDFFEQIPDHRLRRLFLPFNNTGIAIPENKEKTIKMLFELILEEYNQETDETILGCFLKAFLLHLADFRAEGPSSDRKVDAIIADLFRLLEIHFRNHHDASFYAAEMGISLKRINEVLKAKMNSSVSKLIYRLLLVEAKRTLGRGTQSVKEIAYDLGFKDPSYFARFFKQHALCTPEHFRNMMRTV